VTEEEFEQELRFYRQATVEAVARADPRFFWKKEVPALFTRFETLAQDDLIHFHRLCARLLEDEQREVRLGVMKLLSSYGRKDDTLSVLLVQRALKHKDLREEALLALMGVRTRVVLAPLLVLAERGYSSALIMVWRMLQNPGEIERGIAIARKYIDAEEYQLREAALFLLQKYSSMEREAERVLAAVQKYTDELFIDALKKAPPTVVLEPLKALRSTIEEKYGEYRYLSSTIRVLEQKKREADEQKKVD
jgi:hypothetical protein